MTFDGSRPGLEFVIVLFSSLAVALVLYGLFALITLI